MSTLADNIHDLTRPHYPAGATIHDAKVPPLLEQLEAAVTAETRAGSSSSNEPAIPLGAGALSLRQDIEWRARNEQYILTGADIGTLSGIIQSWARIDDLEWIQFLERVTGEWIESIGQILHPVKPPYRPAVPCPSCGILYNEAGDGPGLRVHCWAEDETMLHVGKWSAECIHCQAAWQSGNMLWLAHALTAEPAA